MAGCVLEIVTAWVFPVVLPRPERTEQSPAAVAGGRERAGREDE